MTDRIIEERGPDFIIGGAMKSGTTSVHSFLADLTKVYIPDSEIFFFDVDDVDQHPDFHHEPCHVPDFAQEYKRYRAWYIDHFMEASANQKVGEDSTTYLASRKAPRRIKNLLPNVRLLFIIRDPVARCYSHYWHLVRTRRIGVDFETALLNRHTLIQRSRYAPQLRRYLELFSHEQVSVTIFEELLAKPAEILKRICNHIGVEAPNQPYLPYRNIGRNYRFLAIERYYNRLSRPFRCSRYRGRIPGVPEDAKTDRFLQVLDSLLRRFNRRSGDYPPMKKKVENYLVRLFRRENRGLEELVDTSLGKWWYGW